MCIGICYTVFVIHLVSGLKSIISDSCGFRRTNKESPPGGSGVGWAVRWVVWLRWGKRAEWRVGPRAEGTTNGKTRKDNICAFCFSWLLKTCEAACWSLCWATLWSGAWALALGTVIVPSQTASCTVEESERQGACEGHRGRRPDVVRGKVWACGHAH